MGILRFFKWKFFSSGLLTVHEMTSMSLDLHSLIYLLEEKVLLLSSLPEDNFI